MSELLERLTPHLLPHRRLMVAYSGGVDSTLVAAAAMRVLGAGDVLAVLGDSPSLPRRELEAARSTASVLGLPLEVVQPNEQADAGYIANAGDRCYFCKSHLYGVLQDAARRLGFATIANGANVDDAGDHRPGMRAADEAAVVSPLLDAGFTKAEVRELAASLALPNRDKPAAACLASRIPYGTEVTPQRLARVEAAEDGLHGLGFRGFRVRYHGDVARLEVPLNQMVRLMNPATRNAAVAAVRAAGFTYVAVDLEGFRSGSGNAVLTVSANTEAGTPVKPTMDGARLPLL